MKKTNLFALSSIIIGSTVLFLPVNTAFAAKYFGCQNGFSFQTKNGAARCIKAAGVKKVSAKRCPITTIPGTNVKVGTIYKVDYNKKRDMCVGKIPIGPPTNAIALAVVCPPGYAKKTKRGKDQCFKNRPSVITYPNKQVNK